jgi:integrase/recombinase XerC
VDAAGVGERKRVTPHTLRHVFASELLRAGANLRQVQELLGHKHLDSTQRYTRVTAHELRGAVKRLRWVG